MEEIPTRERTVEQRGLSLSDLGKEKLNSLSGVGPRQLLDLITQGRRKLSFKLLERLFEAEKRLLRRADARALRCGGQWSGSDVQKFKAVG